MALRETRQMVMATEKFIIKQYSPVRGVLFIVILGFGSIWSFFTWIENASFYSGSWLKAILFFGVLIAFIAGSFLLSIWLASARVAITLDHNGLTRKWVSRYFLHFPKKRFIPWSNMLNYRFESEHNSESFTLKLKEGKPMKIVCFHNDIFPMKGDLPSFQWHFPEFVEAWNMANPTAVPIIVGRSFYASIVALLVAVFLVVGVLVMIIGYLLYSPRRIEIFGIFGLVFGALGAFVAKVIMERKKTNSDEL